MVIFGEGVCASDRRARECGREDELGFDEEVQECEDDKDEVSVS